MFIDIENVELKDGHIRSNENNDVLKGNILGKEEDKFILSINDIGKKNTLASFLNDNDVLSLIKSSFGDISSSSQDISYDDIISSNRKIDEKEKICREQIVFI